MTPNPSSIKQEKQQLRRQLLRARRRIPQAQRQHLSAQLAEQLFGLPEWQAASTVGLYASLPEEVQTDGIIERALATGKQVVLPRVIDQERSYLLRWYVIQSMADLERGAYGVREPKVTLPTCEPSAFDLLLVPGVAFDAAGNRMGFGKGYYDRALADFTGFTVALAFGCQMVAHVPTEAWDKRMGCVLGQGM